VTSAVLHPNGSSSNSFFGRRKCHTPKIWLPLPHIRLQPLGLLQQLLLCYLSLMMLLLLLLCRQLLLLLCSARLLSHILLLMVSL
jgi:predicted acyltransferase